MIDKFQQVSNIEYIKNEYGNELWVQVSGHRDMNGADGFFWAGLMPYEKVEQALKKQDWEHHYGAQLPGFVQYGNDEVVYQRYSMTDYEPLVFARNYHGIKEEVIEFSEEFRHLNNLYHDIKANKFFEVEETGDLTEVAKIEGTAAFIKLKYLIKYSAAKQMAVALYFDIRFNSSLTLEELGIEKDYRIVNGEDYTFDIQYSDMMSGFSECKSYSMIMGKKLVCGGDISSSGYWPFDKEKKCESFIIGIDENGDEVEFSSEHQNLANYYGANPENPHYLTPVHFKKEVLNKYYSNSDLYSVEDGLIRCKQLWSLFIDNHHDDYVVVYLGDLGRDLPRKEQLYWKHYNVVPDGGLSEAKFKRDFMAQFSDPEVSDLKFKQKYNGLKKAWTEKYGWDIFLSFTEKDAYNFEHLRLPVVNSQSEFDTQVLSLVKTLIDSLNEKKIWKLITDKSKYSNPKGITKLVAFFDEKGMKGYEVHIQFLRNLQELRSTGSGHRKGKGYEKACSVFSIEELGFVEAFKQILDSATDFVEYIEANM